jgi:hypothetical protein
MRSRPAAIGSCGGVGAAPQVGELVADGAELVGQVVAVGAAGGQLLHPGAAAVEGCPVGYMEMGNGQGPAIVLSRHPHFLQCEPQGSQGEVQPRLHRPFGYPEIVGYLSC